MYGFLSLIVLNLLVANLSLRANIVGKELQFCFLNNEIVGKSVLNFVICRGVLTQGIKSLAIVGNNRFGFVESFPCNVHHFTL